MIEVADEWGVWFPNLLTDGPTGDRLWRTVVQEGRLADLDAASRYDINQLYLKRPETSPGKGPFVILDSYVPGVEIVSRKNTQFLGPDGVSLATARSYINELRTKYPPNTQIAGTQSVRDQAPELVGQGLEGTLVLEVPVQRVPPVTGDPICTAAVTGIDIVIIRDYVGNVYCQ